MFNKKVTYIINSVLAYLAFLFFASMRFFYAFFGNMTFQLFPYILVVVLFGLFVYSLVLCLKVHSKIQLIISFAIDCIFFVASVGLFAYTGSGNMVYYGEELWRILLISLPIAFIAYLVIFNWKKTLVNKIIVWCLLGVFVISGFFALSGIGINKITVDAVVYAVEDKYQIVWSSSVNSTGYVTVGDKKYVDDYAGYADSQCKVHKVEVPMDILDKEKSYTITNRAMIDRQSYDSLQGSAVSKTYTFRPVDESDGLQIYAESDIHDYNGSAIKSAQFYGDKLDLYVLAGDISSSIIYNKNLEFINKTAYEVTKGEIPVVYARGNHETKNKLANQLYKYVGSVNEDFYYTFRLGSLWGVVLDMGEDHNDDWWEFFGAADFDAYRQKQVEFLDKVIDNADEEYNAEGVKTRVVICHEALAFSIDERNTDKIFTPYLYPVFCQLVDKLNTMNIDFCISGHNHQIMYLEGNEARGTEYTKCKEYLGGKTSKTINIKTTGANFPTAIISRKSETQLSATVGSDGAFIGTAFEIIDGRITLRFTNHRKEVISTISPWKEGLSFGKEIVIKG